MLSIKEAVARGKQYAQEVFASEGVSDFQLEEIDFQDGSPNVWLVTVSFLRNQVAEGGASQALGLTPALMALRSSRSFKTIFIDADTGKFLRVMHRAASVAA